MSRNAYLWFECAENAILGLGACIKYVGHVPCARMDFKDYIEREGIERVAEVMGVKPRAVQGWRYRQSRPRPEDAPKLIEHAKGDLSWQDIYPPRDGA